MGAASHYLEDEGIATTGISLVRENTEKMKLPRFLWVPFELGRPFGAPNEPDFQRRVLRTALELLERADGPVILEDFPDDAPVCEQESQETWSCPVSFHSTGHGSGLVQQVLDEINRLAPWHEVYVTARGSSAPPASGMNHQEIVRSLGQLAEDSSELTVPTELPVVEWVRLGCDDLRTWYTEAAQGQPGRASSNELSDWFWQQTALARLIGRAAMHFAKSDDVKLNRFARRAMVPRVYMEQLMPGVEPYV